MSAGVQGEWIVVARIVGPRGNRGEVKADLLTDFPERFLEAETVKIRARAPGGDRGSVGEHRVEEAWFHKGRLVLKLEGFDSIAEAEALSGGEVVIPEQEARALPEGSYWRHDLVGLLAVSPAGRRYGEVVEVQATGGVDVLVLRGEEGEVLVPAAGEYVKEVDIQGGRIVLDLPPEIVELNRK